MILRLSMPSTILTATRFSEGLRRKVIDEAHRVFMTSSISLRWRTASTIVFGSIRYQWLR